MSLDEQRGWRPLKAASQNPNMQEAVASQPATPAPNEPNPQPVVENVDEQEKLISLAPEPQDVGQAAGRIVKRRRHSAS